MNEQAMLLRAGLVGAAILAAVCATFPASARPVRTAPYAKVASAYRGHPVSVARTRVNHFKLNQTMPLRWPVHFDDQFVLDP